MRRNLLVSALVCLVALLICNGCITGKNVMNTKDTSQPLDYSDDFCWVVKPASIDKPVDVFYVYPTIYVGKHPSNMDIADPALRANARGLTKAQAGVYSPHANMFAPFYRQQTAAQQSMDAGNGGRDAYTDPVFQVGARDVERAFDYYLANLNQDRPFILASHSQGTMTLINLMRKRFNDPELQKRLVAAYLIGYSVTRDDLKKYPWMKPAQGASDTGVVVSFNTEGKDAGPSPVLLPGAIAINPLNWKTDSIPASNDENKGAKFFNDAEGKLIEAIPHFAGARIDLQKGVVIATDMKTPTSDKIDLVHMGRWPQGVFHRYDYAFWFNNLEANVRERIAAYLGK
jgi:hypothetical protein